MPPQVRCERCELCDDVTPHSGRRLTVWSALALGLLLGAVGALSDGSRGTAGVAGLLALGAGLFHRGALVRIDCERCRGREWAQRHRRSPLRHPHRTIIDPM